MLETIKQRAFALSDFTKEARHALHRIPELGFEEYKTSAYIKSRLDEIGIPHTGERTWIIGTIEGGLPGKTVALRADIDALPIREETGLPFSSEHPGLMHACGHDSHAAMLLGAAKLLWDMRAEIPGTIRLLFQPAEETDGGAEPMIAAGAMRGVDAVYGLHVAGQAPTGRIATRPGPMYAACDQLHIRVKGVSGHGAHPQSGVDAILIAAQMIVGLQTLVSREIEAVDSAVVTIGIIEGGTANNILCGEVKMVGTLRTLTPEMRAFFHKRIPEFCQDLARAYRGQAEVEIRRGYCACINDADEAARVRRVAESLFGEENFKPLYTSSMGGEDFAYYLLEAPGAIYHVGSGSECGLHNEKFSLDEDCLPFGVTMHAAVALDYLTENQYTK